METITNAHKLPEFDSIKELAEFWDTHDVTDFEDQLEEVTNNVSGQETVVKLYLRPQEAQKVKYLAESRGIAKEMLVQEWIVEKLHEYQSV